MCSRHTLDLKDAETRIGPEGRGDSQYYAAHSTRCVDIIGHCADACSRRPNLMEASVDDGAVRKVFGDAMELEEARRRVQQYRNLQFYVANGQRFGDWGVVAASTSGERVKP